ncbi:uncharacterized protein LOC127863310 [Dreissena polymorpha]|uniref:Uncharacterized protein n=1 Tax=Dreissena polymorpha TaxID=45954 RepID=A0A9D3Y6G1_DREPO|nr:uncharacterized protein LOC127863310 [Dreissena polymorpha]KAH3692745.1 hypothetical protein DPMN_193899 [Dreissena polymorpha]
MSGHSGAKIALIIVGFLIYCITVVLNYLSTGDIIPGLFRNRTGDIADAFYVSATPAGWTFAVIWATIYFWNLAWFIYALTTVCRRDDNGHYIYQLNILSPLFFISFIINNCAVVAWLFLWDRQYLNWALLVIAFTPLTLYICLFISFRRLYGKLNYLSKAGAVKDIWLIRIFVHNGLAFFATWVSIATLLNFAIVLTYYWSVEMQVSVSIALGILSCLIITWFLLDTFAIDKFVRYTVTPYIVVVVALVGSVQKNFDLEDNYRNSMFLAVLLAVAGLLLLLKLVIMFVRACRIPINGNVGDDLKGTLA